MVIILFFCLVLILAVNPTLIGAGAAVLVVILIWLGKRESQTINPYVLFLTTPISLILYSESISPVFLPKMNTEVQLVILCGMFSYLAGLLTLSGKKVPGTIRKSRNYSFSIFLILGLTPHLIGIARGIIPPLMSDPSLARSQYLLPVIGQLILFLPITILIAFKDGSRKKMAISIVGNIIGSILLMSKFPLFLYIIFFAFGYFRHQGKRLLPYPKVIAVFTLVLVPVIFNYIFEIRDDNDQSLYFWRNNISFSLPLLDLYGDYLYLPYIYLTSPWSNFTYIYDISNHLDYGSRSLYGILSFFQLDSLLVHAPPEIRMYPFNTHAYLTDFYLDFGLFGVFSLSYLLGIMVMQIYLKAIRSKDLIDEAIWIIFGFASFMLFFSNHFTNLSYPFISILFFSVYRFLSTPNIRFDRQATRIR